MGHLSELFWLFMASFTAATLLPGLSEGGLAYLAVSEAAIAWTAWAVASAGNTLGAVVNWALGRYLIRYREARWFPFKAKQIEKGEKWFGRFGVWSLLFAWLPVVGDPLTFVAGLLRTRLAIFVLLVAIGKGLRYAVIVWAAQAAAS